jgi:SecD/SecF fusion protein
VRGGDVMGVDFSGGDAVRIEFQQKVEVDQLRVALEGLKTGSPQYQQNLGTGEENLLLTAEFGTGPQAVQALQTAFPEAGFNVLGTETVGPIIGGEILRTSIIATLLALFGILIYVAFRFELSFAVGAIVAILHDVLMTLGIFFLFGRELSAPMVAAVLTIIGFSINDTIVIFDRIREDLKLGVRGSFKDIINIAINQTLSRTLITSGTTLLSALALFIFGGGVINDFAFTFIIGIITGTYSTIYIATALVLWWHKGERPRATTQVIMNEPATADV